MEVHLYPQCEEGRESGAELSATVPVGECPKSTGLGEAGIYENALGDALRQCKLQKDFDMAMARWGMLRRMARKMGAPAELVEHYEDMLVSALITKNPEAATAKVVRLLLEQEFVPLYDAEIIGEYEDVLHRSKFPILNETADALISFIIENGIESSKADFAEPMPDEDDRVFYEVSLSQEDSFLVTGNLKHYPTSPRVLTPAQFLEIV